MLFIVKYNKTIPIHISALSPERNISGQSVEIRGPQKKSDRNLPRTKVTKVVDKRIIFLPVRALFHPTSYEHGSISFFTHCLFLSGIFSIRLSGLEGFHLSLCVCAATYHRRSILWNNVIG